MADVEVKESLEATREKEEKEEKELERQRKEREKQEHDRWEKAPATGKHAGGPLTIGKLEGEIVTLTEIYRGIGPLAVPCTRGEQKAVSGDKIVTAWKDRPEPEEDLEYIYILPTEDSAEELKGISNSEYQSFLRTRSERLEKKSRKTEQQKAIAEKSVGTTNQPSSTPATPVRTTKQTA